MNYRGPLPKFVYYGLVILLLAALVLLFYAERRQSMEYSAYHSKNETGGKKEDKQFTDENTEEAADEDTSQAAADEESAGEAESTEDAGEDADKKSNVYNANDLEGQTDSNASGKNSADSDVSGVHDTLKASIEDALPGIICLGDDGMAGNEAGSLPEALGPAVNEKLFGQIRQKLSDASPSLQVDDLEIPIINKGMADEELSDITASAQTEEGQLYSNHLPVFFFEGNSEMSAQALIDAVDELRSVYKSDQFVLVASTAPGSRWDDALTEAYGDHYLRNETHLPDMTSEDFKSLADKVYDKLDGQGTFDSVNDAVAEAEKSIGQ